MATQMTTQMTNHMPTQKTRLDDTHNKKMTFQMTKPDNHPDDNQMKALKTSDDNTR
jgi:hypothetical protein